MQDTAKLAAQFAAEMGYTPQAIEECGELVYFSAPGGHPRKYWGRINSRGLKKGSIRINN